MFFLYFGASKLEAMFSPNKYPELFYLILFNMQVMILIAYFFSYPYLAKALAFSLLYIWCKRNPIERV